MTDEIHTTWNCPKDGTVMQPMGRRGRSGAWRCPTCPSGGMTPNCHTASRVSGGDGSQTGPRD